MYSTGQLGGEKENMFFLSLRKASFTSGYRKNSAVWEHKLRSCTCRNSLRDFGFAPESAF